MAQYTVPREIRTIAQRAIDYNLSLPISQRAAYEDGPNGKRQPGTGMATARKLVSGRVSDQQIDLMAAWFARHGAANQDQRQDKSSKAAIAWALWGGSPARAWVNRLRG